MISRDEIIMRGLEAAEKGEETHTPWIYSAKVKSGRGNTKNVTGQYYNLRHLMGEAILNHAKEGETIHIYAIQRVMKANLRSRREDV